MEIKRIFDLLERYKTNFNKPDALVKKEGGNWIYYSTEDYINNSTFFSYGLLFLGLNKGDKIATVSNNRPEWNIVDMGTNQAGLIHVPIYPTISVEEYEYILNHCEARILIVGSKQLYNKLFPIANKVANIKAIYTFDKVENTANWSDIIELGKENTLQFEQKLKEIKDNIKSEDLVTIIYTSGTTGTSKGVMLSHENFISNLLSGYQALPLTDKHKVLSFLPLCHVYERLLNYMYQYMGLSIYYAESMGTISENLKDIKADGFCTVPRLLEKVYDSIMAKGKNLPKIKKIIFYWAINTGFKFDFNKRNNLIYKIQLQIADKLVFSNLRKALGGHIKFIGCGGAALQTRLAKLFWAAKIPIQEGYGLTETSPLISFNDNQLPDIKLGTVGVILKDVQVRIADDGEILCKGPNVMLGYYKDAELTKEVIEPDGWFHTGDIGKFVDNKFLMITDRKKEMFKTSSGKYIAPQVIENKLKESFLISQAIVVGENEKFASALISPNFNILQSWCSIKKVHFKENKDLIEIPEVIKRFQKEIDTVNETLGDTERIKRFRLVSDEWGPDSGELSPTLKLKRTYIYNKYDRILEEIYGHIYKSNLSNK